MVTEKTAEVKIQSEINYDNYEHIDTDLAGDPTIEHNPNKRQTIFSKPIRRGFTT